MTTFVLIHGAGDHGFFWHRLEPELHALGHGTVAVDLPCDDDTAGLTDYADAVVEAAADHEDLAIVAQSFGAFTAPLACGRLPARLLVLVAGMVPRPGERGDDWTEHTGYPGPDGATEREIFYGDVPDAVVDEAVAHARGQSGTPGREPWPLDAWPEVPTRFLLARDDRMFPAAWFRGVVRDRLGFDPDEIDGGHCPALSRPHELAARLDAYRAQVGLP